MTLPRTTVDALILVVDDDEAKRYTVAHALGRQNYRVVEAANGHEALEKAAKHQPDLMIVDINLPDIDGFEVCRHIKSTPRTAFIPVLHFSATLNTSEARVHGLQEGADAFLGQDAQPEELLATVRALLRMRHSESVLRRHNARLEILSRAAEHLLASDNPETMMSGLFRQVAEHLHVDMYFNYMVDGDAGVLRLDSCLGIPQDVAASISVLQFGEALCGEAAGQRKPMIASYVQQSEEPKAALIRSLGVRAYACNPLMIGTRLLGTLSFGSCDRDVFAEDELEFLRIVCHYVALAKERQEMLQKARTAADELRAANQRKDEFLANMSHEIRTPMNAVIGLTNILQASKPLTARQQQYLSTLQLSADSLLALINDLLDIAKIESNNVQLESEPFNLREVVEDVASIASVQAYEKGIVLRGQYAEHLREQFLGDANRLKQVLINLVTNAIKFTEHGQVVIDVQAAQEKEGHSVIAIEVADTGIGIASDKLMNIFSKFSQGDSSITRKYGGTGLGLAITKALVDRMEGSITVTSAPGKGSRFVVRLPLRHSASAALQMPSPQPFQAKQARPDAPLILLVEDYKPNLLVACTLLEELGYRFETAANGREALHKTGSTDFAVVLMDVQMPDIDGYTATRLIRERERARSCRAVPIIGVTAYALSGDKEKCLAAGMDDYLSKPFEARELEQKIQYYLQRNAA